MLEVQFREPLARAFQKVPLGPKEEPGEDRVVVGRTSWEQYVAIDEERGPDNSHPRLYYLDEQIEIMTTSLHHERRKDWIALLVMEFINETDIEVFTHGQATMQMLGQAGAEPDASWCFGEEKEFPDLALEIALTSGGLNKLEIYRRFSVPEVWFWRKDRLEVWNLNAEASDYEGPARTSGLLPGLDLALIERCLALPTWREARRAFRQALKPE